MPISNFARADRVGALQHHRTDDDGFRSESALVVNAQRDRFTLRSGRQRINVCTSGREQLQQILDNGIGQEQP
jgi:hypothetical protein